MFFEMRFNLGTLDSVERSLPFGLLVSCASIFGIFCGWLPALQVLPQGQIQDLMTGFKFTERDLV